jgi:iron complex transport system permease protein
MSRYLLFRSRRPPISLQMEKRALLVTIGLALVAFAVLVISTGIGEVKIAPLDVLKVLIGQGDKRDALIVTQFRLPRILVALLVGMGLAASGAILQSIIRNPLASPDVIGITGGASVSAVAFITLFPAVSIVWLPLSAFVGAAVITLLIYLLSWKNGVTALRLVLIGVGIGAAMSALTTLMIVISPIYLTSKAVIWLTGSVYGSNWTNVWTLLPWMAVLLPLAMIFARHINIQQLGDDLATGVGAAVQRHRFLLLLICVGLAGASVAVGGAIGFVGLLAPHIARKLVGPSFGALLPVSALTGGVIVMVADLIARTLFSPLDLPVGIFTSAVGAPFFIYLLYRNRNR